VYKSGELWSNNPEIVTVEFVTFWTMSPEGSTVRHCVDQYTVLFHYYSLGDDTAVPCMLHAAGLCHAFLVDSKFQIYAGV